MREIGPEHVRCVARDFRRQVAETDDGDPVDVDDLPAQVVSPGREKLLRGLSSQKLAEARASGSLIEPAETFEGNDLVPVRADPARAVE